MYLLNITLSHVPVAQTYNPRYLGGWDQKDCDSTVQAKSLLDSISMKKSRAWFCMLVLLSDVVQAGLGKRETLSPKTNQSKKQQVLWSSGRMPASNI
jgi:hypothetical protein